MAQHSRIGKVLVEGAAQTRSVLRRIIRQQLMRKRCGQRPFSAVRPRSCMVSIICKSFLRVSLLSMELRDKLEARRSEARTVRPDLLAGTYPSCACSS